MRRSLQLISSLIALSLGGCFSTPVAPSPLPVEQQEALRCALLGKWRLVGISGESPEYSKNTYVFEGSGHGTYTQQQSGVFGSQLIPTGTTGFTWHLEGRNLILEGSTTATFRVDDWGESSLTWFNYVSSDSFQLNRLGEKPACEVAEIAKQKKLKYPGDCNSAKLTALRLPVGDRHAGMSDPIGKIRGGQRINPFLDALAQLSQRFGTLAPEHLFELRERLFDGVALG